MPELEIKSMLENIIEIFNELDISEEVKIHALSRFGDIMNHIEAHLMGHQAEIDCLKIRIEKLEAKINSIPNKRKFRNKITDSVKFMVG